MIGNFNAKHYIYSVSGQTVRKICTTVRFDVLEMGNRDCAPKARKAPPQHWF